MARILAEVGKAWCFTGRKTFQGKINSDTAETKPAKAKPELVAEQEKEKNFTERVRGFSGEEVAREGLGVSLEKGQKKGGKREKLTKSIVKTTSEEKKVTRGP